VSVLNRKADVLLLDVNVLVALAIHDHPKHAKARVWFRSKRSNGFSTCAITQSGLIRISSNPGIYKVRFFHEGALAALRSLTELPEHEFWPMEVNYETAVSPLRHRITGYKQTTDAYLLGLAIHRRAKFATMDSGVKDIAGPEFADVVELVA
jgi:toxin-antitoxin system PIN domain toxin